MKYCIRNIRKRVLDKGKIVETSRWQSKTDHPAFIELLHVREIIPMKQNKSDMTSECSPLLPWADEHFDERVGGIPLNPPPSHKHWLRGNEEFMIGNKFSHSYPERFWSKKLHVGIRYDIADLNTLIQVLRKEPDTRQAYLPIFFPEDLSASLQHERIPCTLGYHFIIRDGKLDVFYPMRSCDIARHMHNDLYLTNRLAEYVRDKAGLDDVVLGNIHFVVTSLHCFKQDEPIIRKWIENV